MARARGANAKRAKNPKTMLASAPRSPKAPARARSKQASPTGQKARRRRSAAGAVRKDTMILETDHGPRAAWSAARPMFQKR
jgi:hypothetical protein